MARGRGRMEEKRARLRVVTAVLMAMMFASAVAVSLCSRTSGPTVASIGVAAAASAAAAAVGVWLAARRLGERIPRLPLRVHATFFLLAVAFGYLALRTPVGDATGDGITWVKAVEGVAGQHAKVQEREAWGVTRRSLEIHATAGDDPRWLWRVSGDLSDELRRLGGRVVFLVTQPQWAVVDEGGEPLPGADGALLRFVAHSSEGDLRTLRVLPVALSSSPDQRLWRTVTVLLPSDTVRLTLEALPGPAGSTNWYDRVFVSVVSAESSLDVLAGYAEWLLLVLSLYVAGVALHTLVQARSHALPVTTLAEAIALAALLWISLVAVRLATFGLPKSGCSSADRCAAAILSAAHDDSIYVALAFAVAALLVRLAGASQRQQRATLRGFAALSFVSVSVSVLNVEVARTLGGPFNYQWLYYSEFLAGQTARASMLAYVTPTSIAAFVGATIAFAAATALVRRAARSYGTPRAAAVASIAVVLGLGTVLVPAGRGSGGTAESDEAFNPVLSFVRSLFLSLNGTHLFTMSTRADTTDFERVAEAGVQPARVTAPAPGVRNVILFVLESVAAEYVLGERAILSAVPELTRFRQQAISFPNIYAEVPASNQSLASLLTSTYPLMSYKSVTQVDPGVALESISSALAVDGYRTGFFSSGDTRFGRGLEFLAHRFDTRVSYQELECRSEPFRYSNSEWPFQDSYDDRCMLEAFTRWDGTRAGAPFFAVLWPVQTHHPYSVIGQSVTFGVSSEDFDRYLNALRQTDATFGELMRWLHERGLSESTLVVVVGDHGEAFGQHDQWIHASDIYEENVRVPLLLIHPRLFHGEVDETVGGLVDVAPTIMELLGRPPCGSWQGRSLFDQRRSGRAYFFSPFAEFLFGLREGNLKLIVDAGANRSEVYDLASDPREERNLADEMPEFVRAGEQRLAAWVQYQVRHYRRLLNRDVAPGGLGEIRAESTDMR